MAKYSKTFAAFGALLILGLDGGYALICRECTANCVDYNAVQNYTCAASFDRCIKLDFQLYVHRGCARSEQCVPDGSGIDPNGNGPVSLAWRRALEFVGRETVKDLVARGKVIHCCSQDMCNGIPKLQHAFSGFILSLIFAVLFS